VFRKIAILFLFLANSILLLHSAVPHHRHEGMFCMISNEADCSSECDDHEKDHHKQDHPNECEDGVEDCELSTQLIVPANGNSKLQVVVIDLKHNPIFGINQLNFSDKNLSPPFRPDISPHQFIFKLPLCNNYLPESNGLRGPPYFV